MASNRIHYDQENRAPVDLLNRQHKKAGIVPFGKNAGPQKSMGAAGQALRPIDRNVKSNEGTNNTNAMTTEAPFTNGSTACGRSVVVPVAQFEAFKVYEDDEQMARIDEKLRQISKRNVYKGTAEDRFMTKTEAEELQRRKRLEAEAAERQRQLDEQRRNNILVLPQEAEVAATPVGHATKVTVSRNAMLMGGRNGSIKDVFFEMDEYRDDIFSYLREHELRHRPKSGYIQKQPDVTDNMRSILIDWLVEVAEEYRLQTETLYLAVNYMDRFLSYMSVVRAKLQLVGTAAMFLASKYEEIFPPDVSEFVYITDDTYDKCQVTRMEHLILRVLGFDLSVVTPLSFLTCITIACKQEFIRDDLKHEEALFLAMYLSELAMLKVEPYLEYLPSMMASAAIALARHILGAAPWTVGLQKYTGYKLSQLHKAIHFIHGIHAEAPNLQQRAIPEKYKHSRYLEVAKLNACTNLSVFDPDDC